MCYCFNPGWNIRLVAEAAGEDEDSASEGLSELVLYGLSSENPCGARLSVDDQGRLGLACAFSVLTEYAQWDLVSAFHLRIPGNFSFPRGLLWCLHALPCFISRMHR